MKLQKPNELPAETGSLILIYGETGVGKTTSCIQSLPEPILFIKTERRNPKRWVQAADRPDVKIMFATYETYDDAKAFLEDESNWQKYESVVIDSLTYLMNTSLSFEIEDEDFNARKSDASRTKVKKPLIEGTKMSMEGYGALSGLMSRFMSPLGRMSEAGKIVVCTALLQENPKWNRDLEAAPAFKGREFPTNMPGWFDLIGVVEKKFDKAGKPVYPPQVSFNRDGALTKWSGPVPPKGVNKRALNFAKLLGVEM